MKLGLFALNIGALARPDQTVRAARAAEAAGFDSLWVGEHVVLPDPRVPPSPMEPDQPILDPLVALSYLAAHTSRVGLGTGVVILPQRNPLVLAKELASLDVLSGGRLVFGFGVGYLEPEMRAVGVPMEHRGSRADEYLEAMVALWTQERPAYSGRFVRLAEVSAYPRPLQRPHPPIVVGGGRSPAAYRRAVRYGHGWYGYNLTPDDTARHLEGLRDAARREPRRPGLGELEISVTPRGALDAAAVGRFADLGVHRLILNPPRTDAAGVEDFVGSMASLVAGVS